MEKQTIGAFLQTLRKAKGFTQQEVADALGVSNRTLSAWENDKAYPDLLSIPVLADMYGVTADEILRGERKNTEKTPDQELSAKNERAVLKNRLVKFNTQNYILTIIICVAALLMAASFFFPFPYWWGVAFVLACTAADITVFILRIVFYKNGKIKAGISPDEDLTQGQTEHLKNMRITLRKCFMIEGVILFAAGVILFVIAAINNFDGYNALFYSCMALMLAAAVALMIYCIVTSQGDLERWGKDGQKITVSGNRRLAVKCVIGGSIPFLLGLSALIILLLPPFTVDSKDCDGTYDEVKQYIQSIVVTEDSLLCKTYGVSAGEYYFDLPSPNNITETEVDLGGGFTAYINTTGSVYNYDGYIYYTAAADKLTVGEFSFMCFTEDGGYFWNARYNAYQGVTGASAYGNGDVYVSNYFYKANVYGYRHIKERGGKYIVYHVEDIDVLMPWWTYAPLLTLSVTVPLIVYLIKRKRNI